MILGVVHDDDDATTATPAGTPEVAQEAPTGFGVKAALRFGGDQPPVTDADGAKATDALARRRMVADRIAHLGWHPHSTAAAVLLERDFVHRPQIDVTSFCQSLEFFYHCLEDWIGLGNLRTRFAQPEPKAPEQALTLPRA